MHHENVFMQIGLIKYQGCVLEKPNWQKMKFEPLNLHHEPSIP